MEAEIQEAIKQAREKNKGKIAPAKDIYEAIFKAGQREVVEWIEENTQNIYSNATRNVKCLALIIPEWQAKLKEWKL